MTLSEYILNESKKEDFDKEVYSIYIKPEGTRRFFLISCDDVINNIEEYYKYDIYRESKYDDWGYCGICIEAELNPKYYTITVNDILNGNV